LVFAQEISFRVGEQAIEAARDVANVKAYRWYSGGTGVYFVFGEGSAPVL
jgi:hypothetical protein